MKNTTKNLIIRDDVVTYYTPQLDKLYSNTLNNDFSWLKRWIALQMISTRIGINEKYNLDSIEKIFACLEKWIETSSIIDLGELD